MIAIDPIVVRDLPVPLIHIPVGRRHRKALVGGSQPQLDLPQRHVRHLIALDVQGGIERGIQILGKGEVVVGTGSEHGQPGLHFPGGLQLATDGFGLGIGLAIGTCDIRVVDRHLLVVMLRIEEGRRDAEVAVVIAQAEIEIVRRLQLHVIPQILEGDALGQELGRHFRVGVVERPLGRTGVGPAVHEPGRQVLGQIVADAGIGQPDVLVGLLRAQLAVGGQGRIEEIVVGTVRQPGGVVGRDGRKVDVKIAQAGRQMERSEVGLGLDVGGMEDPVPDVGQVAPAGEIGTGAEEVEGPHAGRRRGKQRQVLVPVADLDGHRRNLLLHLEQIAELALLVVHDRIVIAAAAALGTVGGGVVAPAGGAGVIRPEGGGGALPGFGLDFPEKTPLVEILPVVAVIGVVRGGHARHLAREVVAAIKALAFGLVIGQRPILVLAILVVEAVDLEPEPVLEQGLGHAAHEIHPIGVAGAAPFLGVGMGKRTEDPRPAGEFAGIQAGVAAVEAEGADFLRKRRPTDVLRPQDLHVQGAGRVTETETVVGGNRPAEKRHGVDVFHVDEVARGAVAGGDPDGRPVDGLGQAAEGIGRKAPDAEVGLVDQAVGVHGLAVDRGHERIEGGVGIGLGRAAEGLDGAVRQRGHAGRLGVVLNDGTGLLLGRRHLHVRYRVLFLFFPRLVLDLRLPGPEHLAPAEQDHHDHQDAHTAKNLHTPSLPLVCTPNTAAIEAGIPSCRPRTPPAGPPRRKVRPDSPR